MSGNDRGKRRDYQRSYYRENREQYLEYRRRDFLRRHGPGIIAAIGTMWTEQDGRCYLCGEPLRPGRDLHIDHDHSCCPRNKSCSYCRRGLACARCNTLIGLAEDDPDLLRKIADSLAPVLKLTRDRIMARPEQMELGR